MRRLLVFAALLVALPAGAVSIDWVSVGDPGNAPDTATNCVNSAPDCGSVPYAYYISKYEVTNAQYAEFLNAKAASDPLGLYNANMGSDVFFGGITQSGSDGGYVYAAKPGFENKPVTHVSFYDALRFSNWLNNGQGSGDTETGAYTITALGITENTVARNPGAITFLTSENEWYKAAYYDATSASFFDFPTGTNTPTDCVPPGADTGNSANCAAAADGGLTNVGAYQLSDSPYGTFDQGGNVEEWNEESGSLFIYQFRGLRGGAWPDHGLQPASDLSPRGDPRSEESYIGFRIASLVPEPGTGLLVMTGLLGLAARRKRRAQPVGLSGGRARRH